MALQRPRGRLVSRAPVSDTPDIGSTPVLGAEQHLEEALKKVGVICPGCGELTDLSRNEPPDEDETFPWLEHGHVWEFLFLHPMVEQVVADGGLVLGNGGLKIRAERVYACGRPREECAFRFGLIAEGPAGFRPVRCYSSLSLPEVAA